MGFRVMVNDGANKAEGNDLYSIFYWFQLICFGGADSVSGVFDASLD
jgi:hypothetical protein